MRNTLDFLLAVLLRDGKFFRTQKNPDYPVRVQPIPDALIMQIQFAFFKPGGIQVRFWFR